MHYTYILFSDTLNKFYIGCTSISPGDRLNQHLSNHKGFTAKVKDWRIVYVEQYPNLTEARKREIQIKKWKSHERIKALISRNSPTE